MGMLWEVIHVEWSMQKASMSNERKTTRYYTPYMRPPIKKDLGIPVLEIEPIQTRHLVMEM